MNDLPKAHTVRAQLLCEQARKVNNDQWIREVINNLKEQQLNDLVSGKLRLDISNPAFPLRAPAKLFQEKAAKMQPRLSSHAKKKPGKTKTILSHWSKQVRFCQFFSFQCRGVAMDSKSGILAAMGQ